MKDALLKLEEAAARLGVSRTTVYNYVRKGDLKAIRVGGSVRIRESEFERFLREKVGKT